MSDLDNEEYEATKSLKEKTADEMFDKLGYKKEELDNFIIYNYFYTRNKMRFRINFDKKYKTFIKLWSSNKMSFEYITMQDLKAINKKCKELGWIE